MAETMDVDMALAMGIDVWLCLILLAGDKREVLMSCKYVPACALKTMGSDEGC